MTKHQNIQKKVEGNLLVVKPMDVKKTFKDMDENFKRAAKKGVKF